MKTLSRLATLLLLAAVSTASGTDRFSSRAERRPGPDRVEPKASRVKDIRRSFDAIWRPRIDDFVEFDGGVAVSGEGLWRSDGTPEGTVLIGRTTPREMAPVGSDLYFSTSESLWRTDGTPSGAALLARFPSFIFSTPPMWLTDVEGQLYFSAVDPALGYELWRSDGTSSGTGLVVDLIPGRDSSWPTNLATFRGQLVFAAQHEEDAFPGNSGLWTSDGSAGGTSLLRSFYQPPYEGPIATDDALLFASTQFPHGAELWTTDGTGAGTRLVKDIQPRSGWSFPMDLRSFRGMLLFAASGPQTGREIWRSDGTEAGTSVIRDIRPGPLGSSASLLTVLDDSVLLFADDGVHGRELWKTDGSDEGTVLVLDVTRGGASSDPVDMVAAGDVGFFLLDRGGPGLDLWRSDGTAAGTASVDSNVSRATPFLGVGGDLAYFVKDGVRESVELWVTDGSPSGTRLLRRIEGGGRSSHPKQLTVVAGRLFFTADDGIRGSELWGSDGTDAGTGLVADIARGEAASSPRELTAVGRTLFFAASDGERGEELWKLELGGGDHRGVSIPNRRVPELVADLRPGPDPSRPRELTAVEDKLFFTVGELYVSGGTAETTVPLRAIAAALDSYSASELTRFGRLLAFVARSEDGSREVWVTDGTDQGTRFLTSLRWVTELRSSGGFLYFLGEGHLWRSDGTIGGTVPLATLPAASCFRELTVVQDEAFFRACTSADGYELWRYSRGEIRLEDLNPGESSSFPGNLFASCGRLFFYADDGSHGREPWIVESAGDAPRLLADFVPGLAGQASFDPPAFAELGDCRVAFPAADRAHGIEPWVSDGTAAGTFRLADVAPGIGSSFPGSLVRSGDALFFAASGSEAGQPLDRELWRIDLSSMDRGGVETRRGRPRPGPTGLPSAGDPDSAASHERPQGRSWQTGVVRMHAVAAAL